MNASSVCVILLIATAAYAQPGATPAEAATQPATRPATRPNPQGDPVSAVKHLFASIEKGDYAAVRRINLESRTISQLQADYERVAWALSNGYTITVVDSHRSGPVASIICDVNDGRTPDYFAVVAVERFDDWKVEFSGRPNLYHLTPSEREHLVQVTEWRTKRMQELRPSTQPAAAPATAPR